ncbi:hypothetical protein CC86DRAFT_405102 [Ophiobolus disseminans]|uniref:BTB domain-containing protein n=1 Tax=Ophiobolus disseminans TaxID=1469910 RepID=A0A6A7A667_9PLEO|nr:hypothetical protein CC86DRAFT_405102 [Ophiobolus disseminans]
MGEIDSEPLRKNLRHTVDDGPDVDSEPVVILVGAAQHIFYVHKSLLHMTSGFFDRALKKE